MGGRPIALLLSYTRKGSLVGDLDRIVHSVANTCREAGVYVVMDDIKAVEEGSLYSIN
jgi:hydrogenase maturation factor